MTGWHRTIGIKSEDTKQHMKAYYPFSLTLAVKELDGGVAGRLVWTATCQTPQASSLGIQGVVMQKRKLFQAVCSEHWNPTPLFIPTKL